MSSPSEFIKPKASALVVTGDERSLTRVRNHKTLRLQCHESVAPDHEKVHCTRLCCRNSSSPVSRRNVSAAAPTPFAPERCSLRVLVLTRDVSLTSRVCRLSTLEKAVCAPIRSSSGQCASAAPHDNLKPSHTPRGIGARADPDVPHATMERRASCSVH